MVWYIWQGKIITIELFNRPQCEVPVQRPLLVQCIRLLVYSQEVGPLGWSNTAVCNSRTVCHIWQIWLAEKMKHKLCTCSENQVQPEFMILGAPGDLSDYNSASSCFLIKLTALWLTDSAHSISLNHYWSGSLQI